MNYITCASMNRFKYNEVLNLFPSVNIEMRKKIVQYNDPLKVFLELRLNQVDFFRNLPKYIKCDFIF